ncbi:LppU/SCO3897 family protein [Nocardia beijingensis]|uniref:LppU/SCO3897 family protein n=1 Tax=Nocardia beijingensis TaxID=95162 RepID=UPI0033DB92B7
MKFPGTRLLARLVLALAAVAAVVVTVAGCSLIQDAGKSDTAKAGVGDCINVIEGSAVDSKTEPVDCSSDKAVYKVAQSYDKKTACAAEYTSYEETLAGGTTAFLCLAPNFKEGNCYNESSTTGYKHVDCASSEATFKVLKRIDGKADELLCDQDADGFRLIESDPKVTFCTAKPKG